jgi:tetratricopeptide (TPR) repeat protein
MILNQGFDHHGLIIMALTRGFDSLAHLLTGSATVAAIVISQSVAVYAKTGDEVYKIAVPVTVQINSDIGSQTGVIIAKDGNTYTVLTNHHLVCDSETFVNNCNTNRPDTITTYQRQAYTANFVQPFPTNRVTVNNNSKGRVANLNNPSTADDYYARGVANYAQGNYRAAIDDFTKVINLDPNNAKAYYNRGVVRDDLKDYQGAISDYDQAIKINPNDAEAYNNRGVVRDELKDYQGAISDYDQALKINPNDAIAYNNRGNARSNLKDYQGAISDYDKALKIDPNFAAAYNNRGSALYMVGDKRKARGDWETAAQLYRQQGNEDEDGYKNAMDNLRNLK